MCVIFNIYVGEPSNWQPVGHFCLLMVIKMPFETEQTLVFTPAPSNPIFCTLRIWRRKHDYSHVFKEQKLQPLLLIRSSDKE